MDYNGKKELLIDVAAVPGTSGSPVLIIEENGYIDRDGNFYPDKNRIGFLGTLSTAPQPITDERAVRSDVPVAASSYPPLNHGFDIKSSRILELEALF